MKDNTSADSAMSQPTRISPPHMTLFSSFYVFEKSTHRASAITVGKLLTERRDVLRERGRTQSELRDRRRQPGGRRLDELHLDQHGGVAAGAFEEIDRDPPFGFPADLEVLGALVLNLAVEGQPKPAAVLDAGERHAAGGDQQDRL